MIQKQERLYTHEKNTFNHIKVKNMKKFIEDIDDIPINEGILSASFSMASAILIAKKIMTPWKDTDAFKLGLIDQNGKRTNKKAVSSDEKESINLLNTFVFSIRRLLLSIPLIGEGTLKVLVSVYVLKALKEQL